MSLDFIHLTTNARRRACREARAAYVQIWKSVTPQQNMVHLSIKFNPAVNNEDRVLRCGDREKEGDRISFK